VADLAWYEAPPLTSLAPLHRALGTYTHGQLWTAEHLVTAG